MISENSLRNAKVMGMTSKGGATRAKRAIVSIDEETTEATHSTSPRRASIPADRPSPLRVGAVATMASLLVAGSAVMANLSNPASATPNTDPVAAPFDRGSQASRGSQREAIDPAELSTQADDRAAALSDLDRNIASAQAQASSSDRANFLDSTSNGVVVESKRIIDERNKLQFPAEGKPGSPWGMRLHPILGYYRMHWGMDIGAACGSPLRAVYDGTVTVAAFDGASGNHVKIAHDQFRGKSLETNSLHMTNYIVQPGQRVKKGQVIGYTGSTGLSTECHLHFETIWGGTNVDPATLLN